MSEEIIGKMEKAVDQAQRALDGEFGAAAQAERMTIIWFQVRIEHWIEMLKELQSSTGSPNNE